MAKRPTNKTSILVDRLFSDLDALIAIAAEENLSVHRRRQLNGRIEELRGRLDVLIRKVDPIRQPDSLFDPSAPKVVGRFVALALVAQPRRPLADENRYYGSGVYAIYYRGGLPEYGPISNTETPINVGKAKPAANNARSPTEQGAALSSRLAEHRKNINLVENLRIDEFECRSLVVQSGWETAAEDYLIHLFSPIWNSETGILFGLGKHGDAAETRTNRRSPWDTLHPGRKWAANQILVDAKNRNQIAEQLDAHFTQTRVYRQIEDVLSEFVAELRQI